MKKLFILALLIVLGVATQSYAVSIPTSESADDNAGPFVAYVPVTNLSSSSMAVGDVACWSIDESTDDESNYVDDCGEEATGITAGVVIGSAIAAGEKGLMAVHGVVDVNTAAGSECTTVDAPMCASATAPYARTCTTKDAELNGLGFCTQATSTTSAKVFLRRLW